MEQRMVDEAQEPSEEALFETSLRPGSLQEYVGQKRTKESLGILLEAAQQRADVLDHILFCGPPGFGQCTRGAVRNRNLSGS